MKIAGTPTTLAGGWPPAFPVLTRGNGPESAGECDRAGAVHAGSGLRVHQAMAPEVESELEVMTWPGIDSMGVASRTVKVAVPGRSRNPLSWLSTP